VALLAPPDLQTLKQVPIFISRQLKERAHLENVKGKPREVMYLFDCLLMSQYINAKGLGGQGLAGGRL
jgi:hypothetical protein